MVTSRLTGRARLLAAIAIAGVLPTLAHLAYSRFGFNPTDDGLVLAYSRRLLEGEVPGRDFVFIRPVGSALLHAPLLMVAGDYLLWMSRWVVWLEFGAITWSWLVVAQRLTRPMSLTTQVSLGIAAFALAAHNFPLINWYTIDGLFLCSVGTALATSASTRAKAVGYAIVGAATLTKQNFAVVAPLALLTLGDARRPLLWVAAAAAPIAYGVFLLLAGGLVDSWQQLTALGRLQLVGWTNYVENVSCGWGLVLGAASMALLTRRSPMARVAGGVIVLIVLSIVGVAFAAADWPYYGTGAPFLMFGATLGAAAVLALHRDAGAARLNVLAATAAWAVSISLGYNSPALGSGALIIALLAPAIVYLHDVLAGSRSHLVVPVALFGVPPIRSAADARAWLERDLAWADLALQTVHVFSSCPIGERPDRCAADSFGRIRGLSGLYINDASMLPDSPGVNPQATIMAMARRNALAFLRRPA